MDVFNKYRYGEAIMLAATFKNMGNPLRRLALDGQNVD